MPIFTVKRQVPGSKNRIRVNGDIRCRLVRLIGSDGEMVGDVGIAYPESVFFYKSHYSGEQNLAVYSFEFVRIVRKVLPDVSQCQGTQTGIAQRVYGNISVRMGYKAILRVNFDTA